MHKTAKWVEYGLAIQEIITGVTVSYYLSLSQNLVNCLWSKYWRMQISNKTGKSEVA